jgi:RNA polymerase sigma-54 factor
MIDGEAAKKPLSDQKLANLLKEQGFKVARRTVAKYREELGIAPSHLRRSY